MGNAKKIIKVMKRKQQHDNNQYKKMLTEQTICNKNMNNMINTHYFTTIYNPFLKAHI